MLENLEISALKLPQKLTKTANTTQVGVNTPRRMHIRLEGNLSRNRMNELHMKIACVQIQIQYKSNL